MEIIQEVIGDNPQLNRVLEEGVDPRKLTFRFSCQRCGLRCCTYSFVEGIYFSPHTFAYIKTLFDSDQLNQLFERGIID